MTSMVKFESTTRSYMFKRGAMAGFPIMLGYVPIAIAYGVLAKQVGISITELTMMSVFVFAGASQFMGVSMIAAHIGLLEIVIATFVLNFRQFVMSVSFMNQVRHIGLRWKIPLSLGLTDETFAVSSLNKDKAKQPNARYYYVGLFLIAYFSWVFGSLLGGLLGEVIPDALSQSMGIALYAMFIGLLIPSIKKEKRLGAIAVIAMLINLLSLQFLSEGWSIVMGTVFGGLSGVYFLRGKKK